MVVLILANLVVENIGLDILDTNKEYGIYLFSASTAIFLVTLGVIYSFYVVSMEITHRNITTSHFSEDFAEQVTKDGK